MKGVKLGLLGISLGIMGLTLATNNLYAVVCGAVGAAVAMAGFVMKK